MKLQILVGADDGAIKSLKILLENLGCYKIKETPKSTSYDVSAEYNITSGDKFGERQDLLDKIMKSDFYVGQIDAKGY